MTDKEYNKILKQYHKLSDRHILVVETDMPYSDVLKVVILSDKIRKAGNELVSLMRKNYDNFCVQRDTVNYYFCMVIPKIRINAKFMLINLTKCRKHIMSHGIIAENL